MPYGARKNIGLLLGVVLLVIGIIALLNSIGLLPFSIPFSINILSWILAAGGLYLIIESVTEFGARRALALLVAGVILILTLIPILNQFGILSFEIPGLSLTIYHILLLVEGTFLTINAFGT